MISVDSYLNKGYDVFIESTSSMVRDERRTMTVSIASMITKTRMSDYLVGDDDESRGHVRVH